MKGVGRVATGIIPGTLDDQLFNMAFGQPTGRSTFDPRSIGITAPTGRPSTRRFGDACPTGYELRNGRCEKAGIRGTLERTFPGDVGGDQYAWQAAVGRYGYGAVPHPEMREHLVCPPGMVLGRDELCYESLSNKERKWKKGPKPFLTGGERKALQTAARLRGAKGNKAVMKLLGYSKKSRR